MTKLEWCRANAPDAMLSCDDNELLQLMSGAYENFVLDMLPSLELLSKISFPTSLDRSTNKLTVTDDIVSVVVSDVVAYYSAIFPYLNSINGTSRVKSRQSIINKVTRKPDSRFQSVFNDVLGIRLIVPDYLNNYPDYFRVVDMRSGKAADDGYRAVHLYFKLDNFHYCIEIQLWSEYDSIFNRWTHEDGYKTVPAETLAGLRREFEQGLLSSYADYKRRLSECK